MGIADYVALTRTLCCPATPGRYEALAKHLRDVQRQADLENFVDFHFVRSQSKTPGMVEMDGRQYIIYDQQLGEYFDACNRLYLYGGRRASEVHLIKYLAEEYRQKGNDRLYYACLLEHHDLAEHYTIAESSRYHFRLTEAQEAFTMFHELFHSLVPSGSSHLVQYYVDKAKSELMEWKPNFHTTTLDLVEEVASDLFALDFTLKSIASPKEASDASSISRQKVEVAVACYLGALHHRSLALIRSLLADTCGAAPRRSRPIASGVKAFLNRFWPGPKTQSDLIGLFPKLQAQIFERKRVLQYAVRSFLYGIKPEFLTWESAGYKAATETEEPWYSYPGAMMEDILFLHDSSVNDVFAIITAKIKKDGLKYFDDVIQRVELVDNATIRQAADALWLDFDGLSEVEHIKRFRTLIGMSPLE
jgi:hypothetical protein